MNNICSSTQAYFNDIMQYPLLSYEEEKIVAKKVAEGDKIAKDTLINSNLRLVIPIAKKYFGYIKTGTLLDLIHEGNLGLIKAVEKFDYTKGFKFSTYATYWIKQSISSYVIQSGMIRIPPHIANQISSINKVVKEYFKEHNVEPTSAEIAKLTNLSEAYINNIFSANKDWVSLDIPNSDDDTICLKDIIADNDSLSPEAYAIQGEAKRCVNIVLSTLQDREQEVITMRFGLDGKSPKTLEEIGKKYNLSKERIRQIEAKALKKLRHPIRVNLIKDFYK